MIDFERGAKCTGSKFYFLSGKDAIREWTLLDFMIKYHVANGYEFVIPPYLVNKKTAIASGMLPHFAGDFYQTEDDFYLIPTAEKAMVGMHMDEIFKEDQLPIKYVAYSPCFRREAGCAGSRDKGLKRVHQFHKIELYEIHTPDLSYLALDQMVEHVCGMLKVMGVKHRVIELEESDRSPVATKTYDIEVKYGDEWLEVSSCSNTEDRQSKPAQIRYKPNDGKKNVKCHLLNGSGVACPRLTLALEHVPDDELYARLAGAVKAH